MGAPPSPRRWYREVTGGRSPDPRATSSSARPALSESSSRRAAGGGDSPATGAAQEPLIVRGGPLPGSRRAVAAASTRRTREDPLTGHLDVDARRLRITPPSILRYAAEEGRRLLSDEARARQKDLPSTAETRLLVYWSGDRSASEDYLSRAILRPYVEFLRLGQPRARPNAARRAAAPSAEERRGSPPAARVSVEEGARRLLGCALCGLEWLVDRIVCPACFRGGPAPKLPSFQNDRHPAVRIEACETCRRYVKSLDLSQDARPIPEV